MMMMMMVVQMLSVSAVVIANLCVSYIVTNQRESVSIANTSLTYHNYHNLC